MTAPLWMAVNRDVDPPDPGVPQPCDGARRLPVYLLARRLNLSGASALACAAATVVAPGLLYASYMTADAIAFLLALVAVLAAVRVLARPTLATQAWFFLAVGLATFARLQYAVLIPAFMGAALVVERGTSCSAARRFVLVAGVVAACVPAAAILGSRVLGRYEAVTEFGLSSRPALGRLDGSATRRGGRCGPRPGRRCLDRDVARGRGTDRARTGFAALPVMLLGLVIASAVMSVDTGSDRFLERYLIGAFPLVAIAFCCWADDGRPGRFVAIGVAALVIVAAGACPSAASSSVREARTRPRSLP